MPDFMLRSHAALRASTGSFEMLVFHTLSAGNIGQFGAPGTVVVMATGGAGVSDGDGETDDSAGTVGDAETASAAGAALITAPGVRAPAPECGGLVADAGSPTVAHPAPTAMSASTATAAPARRAVVTKCPVSQVTVASWHGRSRRTRYPAEFVRRVLPGGPALQMGPKAGVPPAGLLYSGLPWRHAP